MRKFGIIYIILFGIFFILNQSVKAENIHFYDDIYKLKYTDSKIKSGVIQNEYFKKEETREFWTSMVEISYYPEVNNPIKYATETDKKIELEDKCLLLKLIQNKKQDIAVLSYLENVIQQDKTFFIYNIYKYERHPNKRGMMVLRFAKKYVFNNKDEIVKMAKEIKEINDDYMERIIISPIPPIVEK